MTSDYKIISELHPAEHSVTLLLNGSFNEGALPELERSISEAGIASKRVRIDLSEVTLVDRKTARYFSECASNGVKLVNCPLYLRQWIPQVSDETDF